MPKAEAMASAASIPETKAINKFGHWSKESERRGKKAATTETANITTRDIKPR